MKRDALWWLVLSAASACSRHEEGPEEPVPIAVRCVPAVRGDIDTSVTLYGRVSPAPGEDLRLSSQVPGRIVETKVAEGDRILPGTLIALVDDPTSRDSARQARATVAQAKAAKKSAEATLGRLRGLAANGLSSSQELENAETTASRADAEVSAAEAAAHGAARTAGGLQVRSAFAGTVIKVWRGAGAVVDGTDATPIVQLAATDLELAADATERQLAGIAPGQKAEVSLLSNQKPFSSVVRARPQALDPATGIGVVRIVLGQSDARPIVGSFGTAKIRTNARKSVLTVPASALRGAVSDGAELVVCKDKTAEVRPIVLGARNDQTVEVLSGLSAGELVAIDHVLGLENGSLLADPP